MSLSPTRAALAPSGRRWFAVALVVLFLGLGVKYSFKALANRSAFDRWRPQVQAMEQGIDISERFNYPNPPVMALVLEPLTRLPPLWGALAWFYLKVAMALLALRWVFQMVADAGRPFPAWAQGLAVLLSLKPIIDDLQHGNVNLFILFLVVASLAAYRRGRDVLAGVVLGLAVACKVTPALFVPYFVWKRSWRALAGCALGLALFLWPGFVPALRLGWDGNQRQLASWYRDMVRPFILEGKVTSEHNNQSLPGLVARLATHSPSFVTYPDNVWTPARYDNRLDLSPAQARWLVKGCMALFALLIVWCCRTPTAPRGGWRLAAEFSLVLLGMLLFSERTWKHHCVTLALPFAVLCYYLAACRPGPALRAYLIASLAVAAALLFTTTFQSGEGGRHPAQFGTFAKQAQVYGAYVWAYLVLVAALVVLLRTPLPAPDAPEDALPSAETP
jgi:hypothetical protein